MKIDRQLALVFNFEASDVPADVKEAAIAYRENVLALKKAEKQSELWKQKRKDLQLQSDDTFGALEKALAKWDPSFPLEETSLEEAGE